MKKTVLAACMVILFATAVAADRVEESRTWTETFSVDSLAPTLEISNIWGDVKVGAGRGGEITVTVSEHRSAPDQARFERSLEYLKLNTRADEAGVSMYVGPLAIPAKVEQSRSDGAYRYRIEQAAGVSIAGGGPTFNISSINGDIRIQEIK